MPEILTAEQADAIRTMSLRLSGKPAIDTDRAPEPEARRPIERRRRSATAWSDDPTWAGVELRLHQGAPVLDLANAVRVLERHPDYARRFSYNAEMGKTFDRGKVMLAWQVDAICAEIQERFLPALSESTFQRAMMIAANRSADASA